LWSAHCNTTLVVDLPAYHLVIYIADAINTTEGEVALIARTYDGALRWQTITGNVIGPSAIVAGDGVILVLGRGALPPPRRGAEADPLADEVDYRQAHWVQ